MLELLLQLLWTEGNVVTTVVHQHGRRAGEYIVRVDSVDGQVVGAD